jgi:diketogulonate reductase-like aldo/keto reductase
VVKTAIEIGYRLIDCAFIYGNEVDIGKAFGAVLAEGKIKRDDLFVVGKVGDMFWYVTLQKCRLVFLPISSMISLSLSHYSVMEY